MTLTYLTGRWIALSTYAEKDIAKAARFRWSPERKHWWTEDPAAAEKLRQYADASAAAALDRAKTVQAAAIESSQAAASDLVVPAPAGLAYLPYQVAGIEYCAKALSEKGGPYPSRGVLIADEMG